MPQPDLQPEEPLKEWAVVRKGEPLHRSGSADPSGATDCCRFIHDKIGHSTTWARAHGISIVRINLQEGELES